MVSVPVMRIRKQKGLKQSADQKSIERGRRENNRDIKVVRHLSTMGSYPECRMEYIKHQRKVAGT